jgi:Putative zinc-finger
MFRKTEDGAIDNLLRAHIGRAGGPPPLCRDFDPDLANAFIENSLTAGERARYEQHLALCASCRKSVVVLARMAETDTVFTTPDAKPRGGLQQPEPRWKALFIPAFRPQWAMAVAAVIVLAISVPLFLSRKDRGVNQQQDQSQLSQPSSGNGAATAPRAEQANPAGAAVAGDVAQPESSRQAANTQQDRAAQRQDRSAGEKEESTEQPPAENASGVAGGVVAKAEPPQPQPVEPKTGDQNADQSASKDASREQAPAASAPQQAAPETQLAKIDPAEARRVPQQDKDKAEMSVLQPRRPDGDERANRDAVVRPGEIAPPPPPNSGSRGRNAITSPPAGIKSRLSDPSRHKGGASERKVGGKKFWFKDGTWVDKDYNPDKDMPVVSFIRDSDVYKEHLAKRQGMKSYLTGFTENERVIFIYKGTVYIIVPQEGTR